MVVVVCVVGEGEYWCIVCYGGGGGRELVVCGVEAGGCIGGAVVMCRDERGESWWCHGDMVYGLGGGTHWRYAGAEAA